MNETNLETYTIELRACEPEDLEVMYEIENDPTLWEKGCTTVPYSRYSLKQYIEQTQNDIFADRQVRLMLVNKANLEIVGIADLTDFDPLHNRSAIGLVIRNSFRKNGFGNQALKLLCHYAFYLLHLHQLYAFVAEDNEASLHLFEANGFTRSGKLQDWLETADGIYKSAWIMQKINPM